MGPEPLLKWFSIKSCWQRGSHLSCECRGMGQVDSASPGAMKEKIRAGTMSDQTKAADSAVKPDQKATGKSPYQKDKEAERLVSECDSGTRKRVFNILLADWAKDLPQKAKEYGVTASDGKWLARLEWLQEEWGKPFETKGTNAIRRMTLSGVLELLTLFTLQAADSVETNPSFGVLDNGSKLAKTVVPKLKEMKDAVGAKLEIPTSAVRQLDQLTADCDAMTAEEVKKALEQIKKQITG